MEPCTSPEVPSRPEPSCERNRHQPPDHVESTDLDSRRAGSHSRSHCLQHLRARGRRPLRWRVRQRGPNARPGSDRDSRPCEHHGCSHCALHQRHRPRRHLPRRHLPHKRPLERHRTPPRHHGGNADISIGAITLGTSGREPRRRSWSVTRDVGRKCRQQHSARRLLCLDGACG